MAEYFSNNIRLHDTTTDSQFSDLDNFTVEEKWKISSGTVNLITKFNKDIMLSKSFNLMEATVKEFLFEDTITSMPYPRFSVPFGSSSVETRPKENNIFPANIHSPTVDNSGFSKAPCPHDNQEKLQTVVRKISDHATTTVKEGVQMLTPTPWPTDSIKETQPILDSKTDFRAIPEQKMPVGSAPEICQVRRSTSHLSSRLRLAASFSIENAACQSEDFVPLPMSGKENYSDTRKALSQTFTSSLSSPLHDKGDMCDVPEPKLTSSLGKFRNSSIYPVKAAAPALEYAAEAYRPIANNQPCLNHPILLHPHAAKQPQAAPEKQFHVADRVNAFVLGRAKNVPCV
ncbi:hypothetical protein BGW37DRAFT_549185 [Umbelopsis sp. PMI_123]|nr:hypothetical protein BGW37DRAFT_549185 [Umbelopsis sp. PMI_123]